jgi:hypothetical protein
MAFFDIFERVGSGALVPVSGFKRLSNRKRRPEKIITRAARNRLSSNLTFGFAYSRPLKKRLVCLGQSKLACIDRSKESGSFRSLLLPRDDRTPRTHYCNPQKPFSVLTCPTSLPYELASSACRGNGISRHGLQCRGMLGLCAINKWSRLCLRGLSERRFLLNAQKLQLISQPKS